MLQGSLNPNITFLGEKLWPVAWNKTITSVIPGDPRKCDELVFLITLKVVKLELNYWMEKKAEFYENVSDINYLKIRPLVTTPRLD